jgi:hypothetical protein
VRAVVPKKVDLFVGLSKMHGKVRFDKWSGMSIEPCWKDGEWHSVFRYNAKAGAHRFSTF